MGKFVFSDMDIVVWGETQKLGGAITTFGVAKILLKDILNVRHATKQEIIQYYNRPES